MNASLTLMYRIRLMRRRIMTEYAAESGMMKASGRGGMVTPSTSFRYETGEGAPVVSVMCDGGVDQQWKE